ncbi:MAG: hypothetical protein LBM13_03450 [Candidatus Ancillula sp.]|jgi:hypothetical protein|nr:hypothetical protein [Candidatus Ancillula sp.]
MTYDELVKELKKMYQQYGGPYPALHLFGIKYSEFLENKNKAEIAERATGHKSYGSEISKGTRIAPYVTIR